jgi:hypothetical protein
MKYFLPAFVIVLGLTCTYSQDSTLILGRKDYQNAAAIFDLSDPTGVNIEVDLWGFVRLPGRYRIPINTTFMALMSFSGGPMENTKLEDMRIIRTDTLGKTTVIVLNYGDLLWEEHIKSEKRLNPILQAGDVIIIPEERRYTFRDNLQFYLPIVSGLLTIATFIITVTRKQ